MVVISGKGDFDGKPRPAIVLQHARHAIQSVLVCPLTSVATDSSIPYRIRIDPDATNGLKHASWAMVDKVAAVRQDRLGSTFGRVDAAVLPAILNGLNELIGSR